MLHDGQEKKKERRKREAEGQAGHPTPRLLERYRTEILPALAEKLGRSNPLSLPRLEKIVVNMGVGSAITEKKNLEEAVAALAQITGQKPLVTKSRQAIAGFRLREDMPIGCKVTLRGSRMYEFLDRLISLALPRVRDFRGLNPNAFDGHGNYSLGLVGAVGVSGVEPGQVPAHAGDERDVGHQDRQQRRSARAAAGLRHAVQGRGGPARQSRREA